MCLHWHPTHMHCGCSRCTEISCLLHSSPSVLPLPRVQGATDEERSSVVAHIIRAICAILRGCGEVRNMFANNIGYRVICEGVKHSGAFTDEVLIEFIHLATEQSGPTVHYTQVS